MYEYKVLQYSKLLITTQRKITYQLTTIKKLRRNNIFSAKALIFGLKTW